MNLRDFLQINGVSQAKFAAQVGVTQGLVHQWLTGKTLITAERARDIEAATNGQVTRADLRPDIFGPCATDTTAEHLQQAVSA